ALGGMAVTFLANVGSNVLQTSLLRSAYAFGCLFMLAFLLRYLLGTMAGLGQTAGEAEDDGHKGMHVDLSTPDEHAAALATAEPEAEQAGFVPMQPPSVPKPENAQDIAKVIRHLTNE